MKIIRFLCVTIILSQLALVSTTFAAADSTVAVQPSIEKTWSIMRMWPAADVSGHWAERVFQWGLRNRIIEGYPDGTYQPDRAVNEAEFLILLLRAYKVRPTPSETQKWSDSPYGLAANWQLPTQGRLKPDARTAPITRGTAAEILCVALGYNYSGTDAIRYLLGIGLAEGKTGNSVEGFSALDTVTRAEALQWIRTLKLHGSFKLATRPTVSSDPSKIPPIMPHSEGELKDFIAQPVKLEDFVLQTQGGEKSFPLGTEREVIEQEWGPSEGQDIFGFDVYGLLSVCYDSTGHMVGWKVSDKGTNEVPPIQTPKGIVLNESDFSDVLRLYGTVGYYFGLEKIVEYLYENVEGQIIYRLDSAEIVDPKRAYYIGFILDDRKNNKVSYIYVATYNTAIKTN